MEIGVFRLLAAFVACFLGFTCHLSCVSGEVRTVCQNVTKTKNVTEVYQDSCYFVRTCDYERIVPKNVTKSVCKSVTYTTVATTPVSTTVVLSKDPTMPAQPVLTGPVEIPANATIAPGCWKEVRSRNETRQFPYCCYLCTMTCYEPISIVVNYTAQVCPAVTGRNFTATVHLGSSGDAKGEKKGIDGQLVAYMAISVLGVAIIATIIAFVIQRRRIKSKNAEAGQSCGDWQTEKGESAAALEMNTVSRSGPALHSNQQQEGEETMEESNAETSLLTSRAGGSLELINEDHSSSSKPQTHGHTGKSGARTGGRGLSVGKGSNSEKHALLSDAAELANDDEEEGSGGTNRKEDSPISVRPAELHQPSCPNCHNRTVSPPSLAVTSKSPKPSSRGCTQVETERGRTSRGCTQVETERGRTSRGCTQVETERGRTSEKPEPESVLSVPDRETDIISSEEEGTS